MVDFAREMYGEDGSLEHLVFCLVTGMARPEFEHRLAVLEADALTTEQS